MHRQESNSDGTPAAATEIMGTRCSGFLLSHGDAGMALVYSDPPGLTEIGNLHVT
jgi:hypothetical protein